MNHACPNCGYCPHCGRRNWPQPLPWTFPWHAPRPYWTGDPPYSQRPVITC